jgi:hypothetical protein
MTRENVLWGEERIANELRLKLGIRISPRTVRKYLRTVSRAAARDQRWSTFLKNHATAILACDFFVAVTATFGLLYVFIVIEHGTRRPAHVNVIRRPSANWTLQQLREAAFACDAQRVGDSLQRSASAWCIGAWCAGPSGKRCVDPEVRIPASIGGRCARAR